MPSTNENNGRITYKPAGEADAELLAGLIRKYYEYDHIPFHEKEIRAGLPGFLRDPSLGRAWLVLCGGAVAGYTILTFTFDLEFGGRMATITDLFFEEAYRGKGLGRKTLEHLETFCRDNGISAIELRVETNNKRAFNLYQRFGFRTHDRIPMSMQIRPRRD